MEVPQLGEELRVDGNDVHVACCGVGDEEGPALCAHETNQLLEGRSGHFKARKTKPHVSQELVLERSDRSQVMKHWCLDLGWILILGCGLWLDGSGGAVLLLQHHNTSGTLGYLNQTFFYKVWNFGDVEQEQIEIGELHFAYYLLVLQLH